MEEIAYHESGHAFAAAYLGARVHSISIEPDRNDLPDREGEATYSFRRGQYTQQQVAQNIMFVALAGPVAEMIYRQEPLHPAFVPEWAYDWQQAMDAAAAIQPDERKRLTVLEMLVRKMHELFRRDQHWAAIAAVADNLLAHETLDEDQLAEIFADWLRR